ncbi:hypothetical protein BJY52DRAFT_366509 [Lactarius psammicola]|nr:hypothetical protein BJY52DRAFT_366509 [Lactarius psammicola]
MLWTAYSTWSFNYTTKVTPGTFSEPVPTGTRVPHWAYIDSSISDSWNMSATQLAGVTGTASIVPTSTSEAAQSTTTSHHSPNAGVIAGGVIGGAIGATLIAGVVFWFAIRRRRTRYVSSGLSMHFQGGDKERPLPHSLAEGAPRFYDSSDPMTYPSKEYLPVISQRIGSTSHLQPDDCGYNGPPEN